MAQRGLEIQFNVFTETETTDECLRNAQYHHYGSRRRQQQQQT
jgi:hypothetical protein